MGEWGISGGRPAYPWCPCLYNKKVLQEARPRFYIETFYCPCKVGSGRKVRQWRRGSQTLMKKRRGSPRITTKPQDSLTPAGPNASSLTDPSPPESISGDEDSNGEDDVVYNTDSLTSHTTASSSTSADMLSAEASNSVSPSITESKFSTIMPYLEESGHTSQNVFLETFNRPTCKPTFS